MKTLPIVVLATLLAATNASAAGWPDLSNPRAAKQPAKGDAALIVGIENYADVSDIPGALKNANDWYAYLTLGRGLPTESVRLLRDRDGTVEKIRKFAAEVATRVATGGTLWVVFIGHGAPAADGRDGVLVGYDAQQDADSLYARSLSQSELTALLEKGRQARTVMVLDACFSGRSASGASLVPGLQPLIPVATTKSNSQARITLTAAKSDQFAGPLPGASRPAFSYLVLGGLRGWADSDANGAITAGELIGYASAALSTTLLDRSQTPELRGAGATVLASGAKEKGPDLARLVLAASGGSATTEEKSVDRVGLTAYVLCQRRTKSGAYEDIVSCPEATLSAGDRVKIGIEVDRTARIYVLNFNSTGQFQTLFPDPNVDNELAPRSKIFLPAGDEWLEVDDVAGVTERIQVIASTRKLPELESLRGLDLPPGKEGLSAEVQSAQRVLAPYSARGFKKSPAQSLTLSAGSGPIATIPLVAAHPGVAVIEFPLLHR